MANNMKHGGMKKYLAVSFYDEEEIDRTKAISYMNSIPTKVNYEILEFPADDCLWIVLDVAPNDYTTIGTLCKELDVVSAYGVNITYQSSYHGMEKIYTWDYKNNVLEIG